MFLRQFQYLVAVAEEGALSGARPKRCNVTQPSLSSGIKQALEFELGVPIFLRGRGQRFHGLTRPKVSASPDGRRQVISDCAAMRDEIATMQRQSQGQPARRRMPSVSPVLPVLLEMVRQRHPGVRIDVQFIGNDAMKLGLNNCSLDVAITYLDKADLGRRNTLPICTEKLSLLVLTRTRLPQPHDDKLEGSRSTAFGDAQRSSIHERRFVNQVFARQVRADGKDRVRIDPFI